MKDYNYSKKSLEINWETFANESLYRQNTAAFSTMAMISAEILLRELVPNARGPFRSLVSSYIDRMLAKDTSVITNNPILFAKIVRLGEALFWCDQYEAAKDPRFLTELNRLASAEESERDNYLFLITMASHFYRMDFQVEWPPELPSLNQKTPDLKVTADGATLFIEATCLSPIRPSIQRNIENAIKHKKKKFENPQYRPGMIAIEVEHLGFTSEDTFGILDKKFLFEIKGVLAYDIGADLSFFPRGNRETILGRLVRVVSQIDTDQYGCPLVLVNSFEVELIGNKVEWGERRFFLLGKASSIPVPIFLLEAPRGVPQLFYL